MFGTKRIDKVHFSKEIKLNVTFHFGLHRLAAEYSEIVYLVCTEKLEN